MPQSLKCPSCGAPLLINSREATARCHFCGNSVIVPEDLRAPSTHHHQQASAPAFENILGQAKELGELGQLVRSGNKIEAIKLYRQLFGTNLRDAKEAVERLEAGKSVEVMHVSGGAYNNVQIDPAQFAATPATFHSPARRSMRGPVFLVLFFIVFIFLAGLLVALFAIFRVRESVRDISSVPSTLDPRQKGSKSSPPAPASGMARVALEFGSEGIGPGQFKDARSIGVDSEGRIYVAEYIGGRVQVFDRDGKFITQWMVDQKMPLRGMAVDRRGNVYIAQRGVITRYEGVTGKSLGALRSGGGSNFDDVTATQDGGLVAASTSAARDDIVRFDPSGQVVQTIREAISGQTDRSELNMRVATDGLGNIYALGTFNNAVFKFTREGKFITRIGGEGNQPGQFRAVGAIAVDGQGRIFVSDTKGIQVFDTNGRYIDVFKVEGGYPFALIFNDKNELFVAARTKVVKFTIK